MIQLLRDIENTTLTSDLELVYNVHTTEPLIIPSTILETIFSNHNGAINIHSHALLIRTLAE